MEETDKPWLVIMPDGNVDRRFTPEVSESAQWDACIEWFNMNRDEIESEGFAIAKFSRVRKCQGESV